MNKSERALRKLIRLVRPLADAGRLQLEIKNLPGAGKVEMDSHGIYTITMRPVNQQEDAATIFHELYHIAQNQTGRTVPVWGLGIPPLGLALKVWRRLYPNYSLAEIPEELLAELFSRVIVRSVDALKAQEVYKLFE